MNLLYLVQSIGLNPKKVSYTQGGEYHSPCPRCGGSDRFYIQPERQLKNCTGYYACRQYGLHGDSLQFCIEFLGLTFKEAQEHLGLQPQMVAAPQPMRAVDPWAESTTLHAPNAAWKMKAAGLVEWAGIQLHKHPEIIEQLLQRGISSEMITKYRLGYCPDDFTRSRTGWGLRHELTADGNERGLWIAKGIVIPTLEPSGDVIRIKIRRTDWSPSDKWPKYVAISGSMSGLNIIGDTTRDAMIVVESELDGYALESAVGDRAFAVAVGSCLKEPDNVIGHLAASKSMLLICHDNDDAGLRMFEKWHQRLWACTSLSSADRQGCGPGCE